MSTEVMSTERSGNTTSARSYFITSNNIDCYNTTIEYLKGMKSVSYIISAQEVAPTTGHIHWHTYVHLKNARKLSLKKMGGSNVQPARGSPKQCIDYVSKDGNIVFEYGDRPNQGGHKTVAELKSTDRPDELPWNMFRTWQALHKDDALKFKSTKDMSKYGQMQVYFISGDSNKGKTELAKDIIQQLIDDGKITDYVVACYTDGRWEGIPDDQTGTALLYDEWRDYHMKPSEFIKMIDYNVSLMSRKMDSAVRNQFRYIFITTVQPLNDIYSGSNENPFQWYKRITHSINMDESVRIA